MTSFRLIQLAASLIFAAVLTFAAGEAFACPYPFQTYAGARDNMLSACVHRSAVASNTDAGRVELGACAPSATSQHKPTLAHNRLKQEVALGAASAEAEADAPGLAMDAQPSPPLMLTRIDGGFETCRAPSALISQSTPSNSVPIIVNRNVEAHLRYFQGRGRKHFVKWLGRTGEYMTLLQKILRENSLPEDLFYLALIESGLNPKAKSRARAVGMWQFIRGTAIKYGLRVDWWIDERMDPEMASYAAARYLKDLYGQFGSWYLAVAGYNAGEGRIIRAVRKLGTDDFWEIASYKKSLKRETRDYVPKYIAAMLIAKDPGGYGFTEHEYGGEFSYEKIIISEPTDLDVIAQTAGTTVDEIKRLNPALLRRFTPPNYPDFEIKIPSGSKERFVANIAKVPRGEQITFLMHKVKKGDTVSRIARRYGVDTKPILYINGLRSAGGLKPGSVIAIPVRPAIAEKKNKKDLALTLSNPRG
ncbi:MAG: transglycosylase SLT domain-containing protein [Deltaproteobacteria bacterium]|nr:transglycosylase SLT domain-containing protein [Deltaproteobacteria bacterium]